MFILRTSPHNEDVIWKVARTEAGLLRIAEDYLREIGFDAEELKIRGSKFDWGRQILEVRYTDLISTCDEDVWTKEFYITKVEVIDG